jgi:hypothetical protein
MFGRDNQATAAQPVMAPQDNSQIVSKGGQYLNPTQNPQPQLTTVPQPITYGPPLPPSTDEIMTAPQVTQSPTIDSMPVMASSKDTESVTAPPLLDNDENLDNDLSLTVTPVKESEEEITSKENNSSSDDADNLDNSELLNIKQEALEKLNPLVDKLDQSPEEKFHTLMMMIQASDDQTMIPLAYESAQSIEDEKEKAQALLDVVNEINYFTQKATNNK